MKHDYFTYNGGQGLIPSDAVRISPSQLSKFFDETPEWYRTHLLGEAAAFQGNTATHLGTCVHACAEMMVLENKIDHEAIRNYIASIQDPEVDKSVILYQYPIMANTLINGYLSKQITKGVEVEKFAYEELLPNIYVGGSIDRYSLKAGGTITDYKTMGSLDSARVPTRFPRTYYFQQLTYAWILRQQGYTVNYLELVYVSRANINRVSEKTGKPMKDYPSEVNVVQHEVTTEDMELIESVLHLVAESAQTFQQQPQLRHLLAQDARLKVKPTISDLFKDK